MSRARAARAIARTLGKAMRRKKVPKPRPYRHPVTVAGERGFDAVNRGMRAQKRGLSPFHTQYMGNRVPIKTNARVSLDTMWKTVGVSAERKFERLHPIAKKMRKRKRRK